MKQTAVQTLIEIYYGNEGQLTIKDLEQAKQMEKEQRIRDIDFGHGIPSNVNINYEEYFKLTFKSE
jgi:hypothetical protein